MDKCDLTHVVAVESSFVVGNRFAMLRRTDMIWSWLKSQNILPCSRNTNLICSQDVVVGSNEYMRPWLAVSGNKYLCLAVSGEGCSPSSYHKYDLGKMTWLDIFDTDSIVLVIFCRYVIIFDNI